MALIKLAILCFLFDHYKVLGNEFYCYKIEAPQFFTSNPRHDTYISLSGRNLDSRTKMLEDHASQWIYNPRITTVFHEFSWFTFCLPVNARITQNPFRPCVRENEYSTSWAFPFDEAISKTLKRGRFVFITSSFNHLLQQSLLNSSEINDLLY